MATILFAILIVVVFGTTLTAFVFLATLLTKRRKAAFWTDCQRQENQK
jgi:hypothetical protein